MLRASKLIMKFLLGTMAILAIAIMMFFWRISNGPVEIAGFSPYLKEIIVNQEIATKVDFERSVLTWRGADQNPTGRSSFEVRLLNITIDNADTTLTMQIPQAGMQFNIAALLRGVIAPTFVEFNGLTLNFTLPKDTWESSDISFRDKMKVFLDDFNNSTNLVPRLTRQLLSPPSAENSTGYLQQFSLSNTAINITDELSEKKWIFPDAFLDIRRINQGISITLEGGLKLENLTDIPIQLTIDYDIPSETALTQVQFSNFIPKLVAGKVEGLSDLASLDIPINGKVDFSLDKAFKFPVLDFEFISGSGMVNPGNVYLKPVKIDRSVFNGQYNDEENILRIDTLNVRVDKAMLNAQGIVADIMENPRINIQADVQNIPLVSLKTYWPPDLAPGVYTWIESNVESGLITSGDIKVNILSEMWSMDQFPNDSLIFDFNIVDGETFFLRPMPTISNVEASAKLRMNDFIMSINHGVLDNIVINGGELQFNNIAVKGQSLAHFTIPIKGKVEHILKVIDYEPLGYPSLYGIKENSITGEAETSLTLDFPLIKDLALKDVDFNVEADIQNLSIPALSDDLAITDGTMTLTVDRQGIKANGDIVLNDVNFNAEWSEDFTDTSEFPTTYMIDGIIEGQEWGKLHLPFESYVSGPASINLQLNGEGAGLKIGIGKIDLTNADIRFDPLGWHKDSNNEAQTNFKLSFPSDNSIHVNNIEYLSDDVHSDLQLIYDGERVSRLFVRNFRMPEMDFSSLFEWDNDNKLYQVSLTAKEFNAVPIMDLVLTDTVDEEVETLPDFTFAGSIENIHMRNDITMNDASIITGYKAGNILDFGFQSRWQGNKNLSIIIASGDNENTEIQKLTLNTNDGGQALRGLDFFTSADQGTLNIQADMIKKEMGTSIKGKINAEQFRVANTKAFSELLKEKELAKAQEELKKNGLSFEKFTADFEQYNGVMMLTSGTAKGPTIGITVDGYVDQKYDDISLNGTIIPAYGINSLVSNIPLLGTILAGGKGEGIFAATYNMSGKIDDPKVNINPLMALAPGIFRKIFGVLGSSNKPTLRETAEDTTTPQNKDPVLETNENALETVPPYF